MPAPVMLGRSRRAVRQGNFGDWGIGRCPPSDRFCPSGRHGNIRRGLTLQILKHQGPTVVSGMRKRAWQFSSLTAGHGMTRHRRLLIPNCANQEIHLFTYMHFRERSQMSSSAAWKASPGPDDLRTRAPSLMHLPGVGKILPSPQGSAMGRLTDAIDDTRLFPQVGGQSPTKLLEWLGGFLQCAITDRKASAETKHYSRGRPQVRK